MENQNAWQCFEKSGKIADYLAYVKEQRMIGSLEQTTAVKGDYSSHADDYLGHRHPGEGTGR